MPKAHRETLTEMDADLVADTFRSARRVAAAVEAAFDPDGLNLLQDADDGVTVEWPREELPDDRGREVSAAIREEL